MTDCQKNSLRNLRAESSETSLRRDLFDRNIGQAVPTSLALPSESCQCSNIEILVNMSRQSHVNNVFLEGQKG